MSAISKIALKNPEIIEKIKTATHEKQILELLSANDIEIEHKIIAEDVLSPEIKPARENDTLEEIAKRFWRSPEHPGAPPRPARRRLARGTFVLHRHLEY